jgi:cytochrome c-type biogenesis protein CcmH
MVERLATRLAQSGGDADQWGRLIRSYAALHEADKAQDALAAARKALVGDAKAGLGLDALARELGIDGESAASASAPSAQAPAASTAAPALAAASAAPAASDDAHQAKIRDMVEQLATRLARSGGEADQWGLLIRSYAALHEPSKARDALAAARKALAGDAKAGPGLDALARELGIEGESVASASAPSAPAPAASTEAPALAAAAAAPAASDDAQQAQIRGMVERLATRLAQSGGDADQWGRLIRSYAVLHEPDKARDALAAARKALAGDAKAGLGLDALAQELGIGG